MNDRRFKKIMYENKKRCNRDIADLNIIQLESQIRKSEELFTLGMNEEALMMLNGIKKKNHSLYYFDYNVLRGNIELNENNITTAKYWFNKALESSSEKTSMVSKLANIAYTLDDLNTTMDLLINFEVDSKYRFNQDVELAAIYIREQKYEEALECLLNVNVSKIDAYHRRSFKLLIKLSCDALNINTPNINGLDGVADYKYEVLSSDDDNKPFYRHVRKHFAKDIEDFKFFSDTDPHDLSDNFHSIYKFMRPIKGTDCDFYTVKFDKDIANVNGLPTKHYMVITLLNSNKILTMYPFTPSNTFNIEGFNDLNQRVR